MQKIKLKGNHFYKIMRGARSVVRSSKLTPELGEASLICDNVPPNEIKIIINKVMIVKFEDLNHFDVKDTGFKSLSELREELQIFYQRKIKDRDTVRVVSFFLYENEEDKKDEQ